MIQRNFNKILVLEDDAIIQSSPRELKGPNTNMNTNTNTNTYINTNMNTNNTNTNTNT